MKPNKGYNNHIMPGEAITQTPDQGAEDFNAQEFLRVNGIESLRDRMVNDHDGNAMPLEEALVVCQSARQSIEGAVEMARTFGDGDVLTPMTKYLDKLSDQAQSPVAKKKET